MVTSLAGVDSSSIGFVDGSGSNAAFHSLYSIVVDMVGNVYVADAGNMLIRRLTSSGKSKHVGIVLVWFRF